MIRLTVYIAVVICFTITSRLGAQEIPWFNTMHVNAEDPGAVYRFSFVHLTDTHIGEGIGDYGSEGWLDEPPVGDVGYSAERLRKFVNYINEVHEEEGVDFVLVSGDLTDSGERSEFLKFREIMGELEIPYIPLIGNHDVWPYVDGAVESRPNGDSMINVIFEDIFQDAADFFDIWDDGTRLEYTWNEEAERNNFLQNFYAAYKGFHFIFMDFDPRYPAANDEPGIGPEAEIMDFEGGTWPWVRERLASLDFLGNQNVFLISHHPPAKELWSFYNAFDLEEKQTIMDFLFGYKDHLALWLAGHIHRNKTYQAKTVGVQPYNVVLCAETDANKAVEQGAFRLIKVYESGLPTGLYDDMLAQGLDIFPNPGDGRFTIYLKDNHDKYIRAEVFDNTGRIVAHESLTMLGTSYQFSLDISTLPTGIYYLVLTNENRRFSQKLIIN